MTTFVKNIVIAIVSVFSFSAVSAQSLTQAQLDSLNILNLRAIQASIADNTHRDFAWMSEGKAPTSNKIEVTNRRGFLLGAEGGYNFNHGFEAGVKVGYQGAGFRQFAPEAAVFAGQAKVDGQSYTTYGVEARANFEFGSDNIKVFAGPTAGYKYFTVDTGVQFDGEERNHNQHSNAFTVGVNGGVKIKIGHTSSKKTVSLYGKDGMKHAKKAYTVKNPIYLTVSGSYKAYQVDKPGQITVDVNEIGVKASLTFLF